MTHISERTVCLLETVIPPTDTYSALYPPLALASLSGELRQHRFSSKIFLTKPGDDEEALVESIREQNPLLVGFSVFIGLKLEKALRLSRIIKRSDPTVPILWGGPLPTIIPEQVLSEPAIDFVIRGPGEKPITELSRFLLGQQRLENVMGLSYLAEGRVIHNPSSVRQTYTSNIDWTSFPVDRFIFQTEEGDHIIGFIASRGCPHACRFCYNSSPQSLSWMSRPIENIQSEMLYLRAHFGVTGFLFLDDCFFGNPLKASTLLQWMKKEELQCHSVDIRVDEVNEETLDLLRSVKTRVLFLGVESGCGRMLKLAKKGFEPWQTRRVISLIARYPEMIPLVSGIIGFPTESFDEMKVTLSEFADLARRNSNALVKLNGYLPFPETPFYGPALEQGFIKPKSLKDWCDLGRNTEAIDLSHFPGRMTDGHILFLRRAEQYLKMMRFPRRNSGGIPRRLLLRLFAGLAFYRLRIGMMSFPADLWVYHLLKRLFRTQV